jgi:hypothetical protein
MNDRMCWAGLLLIAALTPGLASAAVIFSDVTLTAETSTRGESLPVVADSKSQTISNGGSGGIEALSRAAGDPFPNQPNTVGSAFASAAHLALGGDILPGVGANGFFLRNALPPNALFAQAEIKQTITNDSTTETESLLGNFFIPQPTTRFFGVGDFFPGGADPLRDAFGFASALLETRLTRPDGSIGGGILVSYGLRTFRDPQTGVFSAESLDGRELPRGEGPDGSLIFLLPELNLQDFNLADLGPGDILEVTYVFTALASTGFGETGVFAAIGDPFNLSAGGGGSFDIQVGDAPSAVPEPGTVATLGLGLIVLGIAARRGRRPQLPLSFPNTRSPEE